MAAPAAAALATAAAAAAAAGAGVGAEVSLDEAEDVLLPLCRTPALLGHLAAAMDHIRSGAAGDEQLRAFRRGYKVRMS
jgi:hypothetical protein